ncbi:hypothetical protein JTB14_010495 [Gonioctena quinquepunctata]|nr:hypothetical protein JTB14_010495 [Gonioctena quinquepunctata]
MRILIVRMSKSRILREKPLRLSSNLCIKQAVAIEAVKCGNRGKKARDIEMLPLVSAIAGLGAGHVGGGRVLGAEFSAGASLLARLWNNTSFGLQQCLRLYAKRTRQQRPCSNLLGENQRRNLREGHIQVNRIGTVCLYGDEDIKNRCNEWKLTLEIVKLDSFTAGQCYKRFRVCSAHFEKHMFSSIQKNKLKRNAVPNIFVSAQHSTREDEAYSGYLKDKQEKEGALRSKELQVEEKKICLEERKLALEERRLVMQEEKQKCINSERIEKLELERERFQLELSERKITNSLLESQQHIIVSLLETFHIRKFDLGWNLLTHSR